MADEQIKPINIAKYEEALNNLIGVDSAYFKGDKDVDAIVEIITLAKKFEGVINRQKAEIDILIRKKETLRDEICDLQTTIESFKNAYKQCAWERDMFSEELKTAKTEAIKEFAEKLKEHIPHFDDGYTTMQCVEGAVKYLVKEMTEGTDES